MRHHRRPKIRHHRRILRDNPLKPKLLNKRLEELQALGMTQQYQQMLQTDLSAANVDPSNAIYVLEWWKARLSLLLFLEITDEEGKARTEDKAYARLLDNLQRYAFKYKLSAYDLALDGELQIDYWNELQHFIQMSGANPYFRTEWPMLHKVVAEMRTRQWDPDTERIVWLGKLVKDNTKLSRRRPPHDEGAPAIKLLRGAYIGDPVGAEEHTELPKEAIVLMEETFKPSDVLTFLKDAEENLQTSTYFLPKYHQPFLTFPDGKAWTVIASEDKENEKQSLGDCATGEYSDSSLIVISLREPVMSTPQGTYYRTRLRAEIVFPSNVPGQPAYEEFKNSAGVVNQLRGSANSKPAPTMHKYIVPLLEQSWVAQLIRPNHRPDDIFWLSDLSPEDRAYLQSKNPKLFDARGFYEQLKDLDYPHRIEEKIMEGIDFPTSYVIEILSDINAREFDYHGGSPRSGVVTRALKRRLQENLPDPELQQLLQATEDSVFRLQSKEVAAKYRQVGYELSAPRILEIIQQIPETGRQPLLELACESLAEKIKRKEEGLEPVKELVRQRLLEEGEKIPSTWPPKKHETSGAMAAQLLETEVVLRSEQVASILEEYYSWRTTTDSDREGSRKYLFHLALRSLAKLTEENQETSSITPILEKIVLDPGIPYPIVKEVLETDAVELTEDQICDLLSEDKLLPGRTLVAFLSLKAKVDSKSLARPQRTLKIARQAMLHLKEKDVIEQALPWIELPVRSIIKVLTAPRMHPTIRDTAIEAIRLKINHGNVQIRNQVFNAVKKLMILTKNKSFIRQLIQIYDGHQHQYRLFHRFLVGRLEWLTLDRNRTFLLGLIENSLPKNRESYHYTNSLPKPLYRLLRKIVADDLIQDNCTFLLKLLFDVKFNDSSLRAVRALLEVILDVILKDPKKLTPELCSWYQRFPVGWGSTEHKTFQNTLPLSPKLLRQFIGLLKITQSTGDDCYLDLAVTIATRMSSEDKVKLQKLTLALVKGTYSDQKGRVTYQDYLTKLLPRRLRRRRHG
jgi:hypothetical protein